MLNMNSNMDNEVKIDEGSHNKSHAFCEPDDDYEHIDSNVEYIIENVLMEKPDITTKSYEDLSNLYNTFYDSRCNCCQTTSDCNDSKFCIHGGCYLVFLRDSNEKELVLNKHRNVKDLLYECNSQCSCLTKVCTNRLVQFGPRKHLKIVNATNLANQLGLSTEQFIPQGGFICEYAGEVLTENEALQRNMQNRNHNLKNYLICLNEYSTTQSTDIDQRSVNGQCIQTFIDAGRKSNIGRYLNHSCDPNCEILSVRVDGPTPKLGIFAKKDIITAEELCFDYGDVKNTLNNKQLCLCGTLKCGFQCWKSYYVFARGQERKSEIASERADPKFEILEISKYLETKSNLLLL